VTVAETPKGQELLREDVTWVPQPAFSKPVTDEWRREVNWNFTADDLSFT
jgi:hypothetical protein